MSFMQHEILDLKFGKCDICIWKNVSVRQDWKGKAYNEVVNLLSVCYMNNIVNETIDAIYNIFLFKYNFIR